MIQCAQISIKTQILKNSSQILSDFSWCSNQQNKHTPTPMFRFCHRSQGCLGTRPDSVVWSVLRKSVTPPLNSENCLQVFDYRLQDCGIFLVFKPFEKLCDNHMNHCSFSNPSTARIVREWYTLQQGSHFLKTKHKHQTWHADLPIQWCRGFSCLGNIWTL